MTQIISVSNQKGGVGKTTTAINLGAELATRGYRVLLVDVDPQANSTSGMGFGKDEPDTVMDVLFKRKKVSETVRPTGVEKFWILPSGRELVSAELNMHRFSSREYRLKSVLDGVQNGYDVVFLDTPPSLGLLTVNALTAADYILIPIQCEYFALEGLSDLMTTLEKIRGSLNPFLEIAGILLTMFDERTNLSFQVAEEVRNFFPQKVFHTYIPRNVRLSESPSFGKPITEYDPGCRGAEAYRRLASEFSRRCLRRT